MDYMSFDLQVFTAIHNLAGISKFLDFIGIFLASYLPLFLIAGLLFLFIKYRYSFRDFAFLTLSFLLARGVILEIIRFIYHRPRPFLELGFEPLVGHSATAAFPSGHATTFFAIAFALWFINKRWGIWYGVFATLMGLGRIYVGVHWPLDIVGGILVALLSVIVIKWVLPPHQRSTALRG